MRMFLLLLHIVVVGLLVHFRKRLQFRARVLEEEEEEEENETAMQERMFFYFVALYDVIVQRAAHQHRRSMSLRNQIETSPSSLRR